MSSPPRDGAVLSTSPLSIPSVSPAGRRSTSPSVNSSELTPRARHSPTLTRSFDPNDPQVRERQRTMDVDMALQLSRARRETISAGNSPYEGPPPPEHPFPFPALSPREEQEIGIARGELLHTAVGDEDGMVRDRHPSLVNLHPVLHSSHDPSLLVSRLPRESQNLSTSNLGLPTYRESPSHSVFDFSTMEEFASEEKTKLGLTSPTTRFSINALRRRNAEATSSHIPDQLQQPEDGPSDLSSSSPRNARHRKLSQSNPNPRVSRKGIGGKMALFEGNAGEPPPSLPARLGLVLGQQGMSSVSSFDKAAPGAVSGAGILNTGHDRPYRFSFYSNALSATIHARSLSELPADGQSFEELFTGVPSISEQQQGQQSRTAASSYNTSEPPQRTAPAPGYGASGDNDSSYFPSRKPSPPDFQKGGNNGGMIGSGGDFDGNTWWLDVQSPTDEEMRMLSKVFSIHPLTTEDIQMEETREKIELFRNYYLVCFRSFDQDPYSPTHLEPLNMYIIVFREGILSFHFRPTPHPQNVRRRIKQLKDYISVTSDWISYALIDDITDAFGPLIQSIEYEVDSIDELVLILKEAEQSDMLRRIGTCRKKVMGLLRLMGNKADVVKGLAKRCNENWRVAPTSDIGLYLSDIQDHLITMTQNLNHYEKILSRSHSNYLAQISIEMTDANNQINDVLSKLTALGTVLIPMNLVTGLWGMNVHVPGEGQDGYTWFVSIIACLVAFACIGGYSTYKFMLR